jgi:aminoglycoside phosphotransferase
MVLPVGTTLNGSTDVARQAVRDALGQAPWAVSPLGGSMGRTYLARADRTVVVRLDADQEVLRRVATLGVSPQVLASGDVAGRTFVILEHVAGTTATASDLASRELDLARLVARYAGDHDLSGLATPLGVADILDAAAARIAALDEPDSWTPALDRLEGLADRVETVPPVASHGDPNATNFLMTAGRLCLVDWDDLRSADPMRDLGQLAWWYLPRRRWAPFTEAAGVAWTRAVETRLFWWVASESLDVALQLAPEHPQASRAFRDDAEAALLGLTNPRRGR